MKRFILVLVLVSMSFGNDFLQTCAIDFDNGFMYWVAKIDSAKRIESPLPMVEFLYLRNYKIYKTDMDTNVIDSIYFGEQYLVNPGSSPDCKIILNKDNNSLLVFISKPYSTIGLNLSTSPYNKWFLRVNCSSMDMVMSFSYSETLLEEWRKWVSENILTWYNSTRVIETRAKIRMAPRYTQCHEYNLLGRTISKNVGNKSIRTIIITR